MTTWLGWALGAAIVLQAGALAGGDAPVDRVADAIAAGEAALADGKPAGLAAAARRLDRLSAQPIEGQADLAERWRVRGGAKDRGGPPMRGRALGPAYRGGQLTAGARIDIEQIFLGGEAAVIVVVPQAGRSLQMRVADVDQSAVCGQTVLSPKTTCRWLPIFTGRFRISVINSGATTARYYLVSN